MEIILPKRTRVQRIWDAKAKQGLSCQMIVDKALELGKPVSMPTVKRICNHNADDECALPSSFAAVEAALGIDYDNTIERLTEDVTRLEEKLSAANALLDSRAEQIQQLKAESAARDKQIESMRETVKTYQAAIKRKNKLLRVLVIAVVFFAFLAVLLFATDMLTPSPGFFRRLL